MALKGSLEDFGLADILQLIHFQRKSGVLTIEGQVDKITLQFFNGNIVGVESKKRPEENRIGKVLLKRGLINEGELKVALEEQRRTGGKLGSILVKREFIEREEIQEILMNQFKEAVVQIFGWKQGNYEFIPKAISIDRELPISLDTQHLLMDGLRILDEWSLIEDKLSLETVFIKKARYTAVLAKEEEEILHLVDGENDLGTIISISGKDDFLIAKILLSLMEKGVIEAREPAPVVAEKVPEKVKKRVRLYYFLPVFAIAVSILLSVLPVLSKKDDIFKRFSASATIENLRLKIEVYRLEHGSYPATLEGISKKLDPWGKPYLYNRDENTFSILSNGPDGRKGTADDIY